jgi:acetylornithine/succinyldiaminopimelate/putrescine aminotransferase
MTKPGQYLFDITHRVPLAFVRGAGSTLISKAGQEYLDFWNDEGVASLGYGTPILRDTAMELLDNRTPHRLPRAYHGPLRELNAATLVNRVGFEDATEHGKVFYANSGAEANETAIKLARLWQHKHGDPNKMGVVTLKGNFHGRTAFAMACSDSTDSPYHKEGFGPMPPKFGTIEYRSGDLQRDSGRVAPNGGWFWMLGGPSTTLPPGDDPTLTWAEVGAINLAPVLGNNCITTYPPEFFKHLRQFADANGILIIFDDVQAGSGRCGYHSSWQHPEIDMRPDILCLGKGMAMGFPMSAVIAMTSIARAMTPGTHFNSMAGSEWVCHHSTRFISWLDENLERVRAKGDLIRLDLAELPYVDKVHGYGMMIAFDLDWVNLPYNGRQFCEACHANGLLLMTWRDKGAIRFNPPLNVSFTDLNHALKMMDVAHASLIAHFS